MVFAKAGLRRRSNCLFQVSSHQSDPRFSGVSTLQKRVSAIAQIYWEGHFYPGELTEVGIKSLRLELDGSTTSNSQILQEQDWQRMQQEKPLVGLLVTEETTEPIPQRFLVQIVAVEVLTTQYSSDSFPRKVAIELIFPEQVKERQAGKIKQLVKVLQ